MINPTKPTWRCLNELKFALPFFIFFFSGPVFAIQINIATMIENLSKTIPNLMQLVTAFAYVMGMYFIFKGILGLKQFGESRTSMSGGELKGPLVTLFVGAAMLYLPSSVSVGLSTFWSEPSPYAYVDEGNDPWWELIKSILLIVQLVGVIAFIRGLIILTHLGEKGGQPGTFGKAMAHMIGGIFCINMFQLIQTIWNTLGLGQI